MIKVALLCTNASPSARPPMSLVVGVLEGKVAVPASIPNNSANNSMKIKAMRGSILWEVVKMMRPWL